MAEVSFICCECGRMLRRLGASEPPDCGLCMVCTMEPGWFRDPELRSAIDPDHPGTEVCEWPRASEKETSWL